MSCCVVLVNMFVKKFAVKIKAYLSVVHDASNGVLLQLLVVMWESQKYNGTILSASIT